MTERCGHPPSRSPAACAILMGSNGLDCRNDGKMKPGPRLEKLRERFHREAQKAAEGRPVSLTSPAFRELVERKREQGR